MIWEANNLTCTTFPCTEITQVTLGKANKTITPKNGLQEHLSGTVCNAQFSYINKIGQLLGTRHGICRQKSVNFGLKICKIVDYRDRGTRLELA